METNLAVRLDDGVEDPLEWIDRLASARTEACARSRSALALAWGVSKGHVTRVLELERPGTPHNFLRMVWGLGKASWTTTAPLIEAVLEVAVQAAVLGKPRIDLDTALDAELRAHAAKTYALHRFARTGDMAELRPALWENRDAERQLLLAARAVERSR